MDNAKRILLVKTPLAARTLDNATDGEEELVAVGDAYAVVRGQRHAEGLRFHRRARRTFTMPYDYRPIPWYESPDLLLLEYPGFFTIALHGKNVIELEPLIVDRRVTWLRECSPAEVTDLPIAAVRADILHAYPSREEEDIGAEP